MMADDNFDLSDFSHHGQLELRDGGSTLYIGKRRHHQKFNNLNVYELNTRFRSRVN